MAMQPVSGPVSGTAQPVSAQKTPKQPEAVTRLPTPPPEPSAEQIERAVEEIRRVVAPVARDLQFSVDAETGRTLIRVLDGTTKEVIRQIPSEEVLAIARALDRMQGVLLKEKA